MLVTMLALPEFRHVGSESAAVARAAALAAGPRASQIACAGSWSNKQAVTKYKKDANNKSYDV